MKTPAYSEFVLRRFHSLTGVIPLTFFIIFHFYANSASTVSEAKFDETTATLRSMPYLLAVEWGLLFAPFIFHMLYGMYIIFSATPNAARLPYRRNWAYVAQRVTAMVVFVFIISHVVGLRFIDAHGETSVHALLHQKLSNPFTYWWYVVGIACTVFHLANGLCTFFMTWGITVGTKSQRVAEVAMAGLGIVIFAIGIGALNGFVNNKPVKPLTKQHAAQAAPAQPESLQAALPQE